jgi:hypothetical protein
MFNETSGQDLEVLLLVIRALVSCQAPPNSMGTRGRRDCNTSVIRGL